MDTNIMDIIGQVTYANYSLVAALTTRTPSGGAGSLLIKIGELYPAGGIDHARITDEALLDYGKDTAATFPVSVPDLQGNTVTAFTLTGPQYNASAGVIARRNGRFGTTYLLKDAPWPYQSVRWGDYLAVAPGPPRSAGGPSQMWISGLYAGLPVKELSEWITIFGDAQPAVQQPQSTDAEPTAGR